MKARRLRVWLEDIDCDWLFPTAMKLMGTSILDVNMMINVNKLLF